MLNIRREPAVLKQLLAGRRIENRHFRIQVSELVPRTRTEYNGLACHHSKYCTLDRWPSKPGLDAGVDKKCSVSQADRRTAHIVAGPSGSRDKDDVAHTLCSRGFEVVDALPQSFSVALVPEA